jgi:hypothetical protein
MEEELEVKLLNHRQEEEEEAAVLEEQEVLEVFLFCLELLSRSL